MAPSRFEIDLAGATGDVLAHFGVPVRIDFAAGGSAGPLDGNGKPLRAILDENHEIVRELQDTEISATAPVLSLRPSDWPQPVRQNDVVTVDPDTAARKFRVAEAQTPDRDWQRIILVRTQ